MKERPILFSALMIRALLAGTKTQTRRALKVQPPPLTGQVSTWHHPDPRPMFYAWVPTPNGDGGAEISEWPPVPCPYGAPGDRLWVREAWRVSDHFDKIPPRDVPTGCEVWYEATSVVSRQWRTAIGKLRPSMFTPRWASRITLEVVSVRVERLKDISEADAIAEGVHADRACRQDDDTSVFNRIGPVRGNSFPIARYAALWESINGAGSWAANPFVWVVEFRRLP